MHRFLLTALLFIILFLHGCAPAPKIPTLSEAHKKFIKLCKNEYNLDVVLSQADSTLWIYVPLEQPLFDYKAGEKKDLPQTQVQQFKIDLLRGEIKDGELVISYDIHKENLYPEDPGYASYTPEDFNRTYRKIFEGIYRIYFNVEGVPGDIAMPTADMQRSHDELVGSYVRTDRGPEFFIIVFADITRGIMMQYVGTLEDYKKYSVSALPQEEYTLRIVSDMTGNTTLIGNKTGSGLDFYALTWPEFFKRQTLSRITFKLTKSSHPPSDDVAGEFEKIIQETRAAYPEQAFPPYRLIDMRKL